MRGPSESGRGEESGSRDCTQTVKSSKRKLHGEEPDESNRRARESYRFTIHSWTNKTVTS